MSQMYVSIIVSFEDDGLPVFRKNTMSCYEPLVNRDLSEAERIKRTLELVKGDDHKQRISMVAHIYPYLGWGAKMTMVDPCQYRLEFDAGNSGLDFARDLAMVFAAYPNIANVRAKVWSGDEFYDEHKDEEYAMEFVLDKKSMWHKVEA